MSCIKGTNDNDMAKDCAGRGEDLKSVLGDLEASQFDKESISQPMIGMGNRSDAVNIDPESVIRHQRAKICRVGTFTLGLSYIFTGISLITLMVIGLEAFMHTVSYSPLLLISFGIEIVFFSIFLNSREWHHSILSFLICALIIISSALIIVIGPFIIRYTEVLQLTPDIKNDIMGSVSNRQNIAYINISNSIAGNDIFSTPVDLRLHLIPSIDTEEEFLNEVITIINDLASSEFMFRKIMISVVSQDGMDPMYISLTSPYYEEWSVDTIKSMMQY